MVDANIRMKLTMCCGRVIGSDPFVRDLRWCIHQDSWFSRTHDTETSLLPSGVISALSGIRLIDREEVRGRILFYHSIGNAAGASGGK